MLHAMEEPMSSTALAEKNNSQLGDFIEDVEAIDDGCCCSRYVRESVKNALAVLSERERAVLELRFGLVDGKDHTLEEVGQHFNVTRETYPPDSGPKLFANYAIRLAVVIYAIFWDN